MFRITKIMNINPIYFLITKGLILIFDIHRLSSMKFFVTLLFSSVILQGIGQNNLGKNEIGIVGGMTISPTDFGKFGFTYRRAFNSSFHFSATLTYDYLGATDYLENVPVYSSDSIKIHRNQTGWNRVYAVGVGIDYEPLKFISIGTYFIGGINNTCVGIEDVGFKYDETNNTWEESPTSSHDFHGGIPREQDNGSYQPKDRHYAGPIGANNYVVVGLGLNLGVQIPLSNQIELGVFYAPQFTRNILVQSTINYLGEGLIYEDFEDYNRMQHYLDLKLRYRF